VHAFAGRGVYARHAHWASCTIQQTGALSSRHLNTKTKQGLCADQLSEPRTYAGGGIGHELAAPIALTCVGGIQRAALCARWGAFSDHELGSVAENEHCGPPPTKKRNSAPSNATLSMSHVCKSAQRGWHLGQSTRAVAAAGPRLPVEARRAHEMPAPHTDDRVIELS